MFSVSAVVKSEPQATPEEAGAELPRYEPIQELGRGAMGEVWLMRDIYLRRKVASKQLLPQMTTPEVQDQFLSEAQITARLEHPGVIPVYTLEIDAEQRMSYAMKVVQGKTLKEEILALKQAQEKNPNLKEWRNELYRLLEIFLKVCDAMDYAHSKGIIHRDLKPANIMIGPFREVYVLDWGIAKVWNTPEEESETSQNKVIAGTPRYLSPEQARCRKLDPKSDQYTLGLILQEILTLTPAFQAKSMPEMLKKILTGNRASCSQALGLHSIPADLQAIVARSVALKAADRYASVADMATDLRQYMQDNETQVLPDNLPRRLLRWVRHNPQRAMLGSLLMLFCCSLAVAGSLYIWQKTLIQTQRRKAVLEELQLQLTIAGQNLDSYLGGLEARLEYLTGAAAESWLRGKDLAGPMYTPSHLPQQALLTPEQEAPVFWSFPVWLDNPSSSFARLNSLTPIFQRVFAVAANPQNKVPDWLQSKTHSSPVGWASVQFDQGPHLIYPGSPQASEVPELLTQAKTHAGYQAQGQTRPFWFAQESMGTESYFSVLAPIKGDQGQTLGEAALLIHSPYLLQELKKMQIQEGLLSLQVLNAKGEILFEIVKQPAQSDLPADIRADLKAGQSGLKETADGLYFYQALATADWRLLARFDFQKLLTQEPSPHV